MSDPQFTTLDNQLTSNIIAEIDDKITQTQEIMLEEESQGDLSQQAQVPQCIKAPSTSSSAEKELHELTHFPLRSWCEICHKTKGLHGQRKHQLHKRGRRSVGSFLLQRSRRHSESPGCYLHGDYHLNVWCCHCSRFFQ